MASRCSVVGVLALSAGLLLPTQSLAASARAEAPSEPPTRPYLRFPDIHDNTFTFVCRGDVWVTAADGAAARLTNTPGREYFPKFSPDGQWIAYTAEVSGSPQVWVIRSAGGDPRQLTYYPSRDGFYYDDAFPTKIGFDHQVVGWSADGERVIFRSARKDVGWWTARFFSIPRSGGLPEPLPLSEGGTLTPEPNGSRVAFTRSTKEFNLSEAWHGYQGGMAPDLWIFDPPSAQLQRVTAWQGSDAHPVWTSAGLYFLSDRNGIMNLFRWDERSHSARQVTYENTWHLRWAGTDGKKIVLRRGADLLHFDPQTETTRVLDLDVPCQPEPRPRDVSQSVESLSVRDDGRLALVARGEIFLLEDGLAKVLKPSPASRERDVAWSRDGSRLAWISDEGGKPAVWIADAEGRKQRKLTEKGEGPLRLPVWSPDGRHIAYHDYGGQLWVVDVATGRSQAVAKSPIRRIDRYAWMPDGAVLLWQEYIDSDRSALVALHLATDELVILSDPRFSDSNPVVTRDGDVFFLSKRHFKPSVGWIEYDYTLHDLDGLYRMDRRSVAQAWSNEPDRGGKRLPPTVHATRIPAPPGTLSDLTTGLRVVYYWRGEERSDRQPGLYSWSFETDEEMFVSTSLEYLSISPNGRTVATVEGGRTGIFQTSDGSLPATESSEWMPLNLTLDQHDPRAEWHQIVREAWRWQRALHYFSDEPIDWDGLLTRHLPLVDRATDRDDVNDILGELIAELRVGHLFARGGDLDRGETVETGGLLGLELGAGEDGRYRVEAVLGRGALSIDGARSPWTAAGREVEVGDVLLAIDGTPLAVPTNPHERLVDRRGKAVQLSFARGPEDAKRWTETIEALPSEAPLRYADWLEQNRSAVLEATDERVGYVHIPNFSEHGLAIFAQQYYSERHRNGLIIDTRFADGGYLAEAILERLTRTSWGYNDCRSCGRWTYPAAAFDGKLVLLTDRYSSSDGDLFSYFFQRLGLGPVVGTRTWGGVIGSHALELVDGGLVGSADNAVTNLEGVPEAENRGVTPNVEVERLPHEFARGVDRQLTAAIAEIERLLPTDQKEGPR